MKDIEEIIKLIYLFKEFRDIDSKSFLFIKSMLKELTKKSEAI